MNIRKAVDYSTMFATLESVMKADLPQMELYCEIGKAVCAHSEKGAAVAAAEFIKEQYPDMTGFSPRNVRRMRDFWQLYSGTPELLGEALHLNWTQNVVIMEAELPAEERRWYIRQATARNLSKAELLRMIEDSAYLESVLDEKVDVWYNEADYDDWDLNGDLLVWDSVNGQALELSSMGIRVSPESLDRQLTLAGCDARRDLPFHKQLLAGQLPYTMGGGIGQSRVSMFLLGKAHIGEVQCSMWDEANIEACKKAGVTLL